MNYDQERTREQLRVLDPEFTRFVQDYKPGQPTLILLPGGLGSDLERASQAFYDGDLPASLSYDTVWLDASIVCDALDLGMVGDIDAAHRICVANGPVALLGLDPYGVFRRWCDENAFNYFILGWDWRRVLKPTVDFLATQLLPTLQKRIEDTFCQDPLVGFTLIGHSEGGFVAKLFLHSGSAYLQKMARAVTVATPFYGYAGQLHRYFSGEDYLNDIYGKTTMAKLIASMCGSYALLFTDLATFNRDKAALDQDLEFPPPQWPCVDLSTRQPVDPYAPTSQGGKFRYPQASWFLESQLPPGNAVRQSITAPLPDDLNARFFNLRGVQTADGEVANNTSVGLTWDWVDAGFDPDTYSSPLADTGGAGDDTIPAWSARLVTTPAQNVVTVRDDESGLNHMFLMEHDRVLTQLGNLVAPGQPLLSARRALVPAATPKETIRFLNDLRRASRARKTTRAFVAAFDYRTLQSFARRFLMDAMRKPPLRS